MLPRQINTTVALIYDDSNQLVRMKYDFGSLAAIAQAVDGHLGCLELRSDAVYAVASDASPHLRGGEMCVTLQRKPLAGQALDLLEQDDDFFGAARPMPILAAFEIVWLSLNCQLLLTQLRCASRSLWATMTSCDGVADDARQRRLIDRPRLVTTALHAVISATRRF